jgi:hypothetical protein
MNDDAEMPERMGDRTTDLRMKHRGLGQPILNKTMVPGKWLFCFAILLLLVCGTVHAQLLTSASWECVCADPGCQVCEEGACCNDSCTIAGTDTCVAFECTGKGTCGLPNTSVGSPCRQTSRFEIVSNPASSTQLPTCTQTAGCAQSPCDSHVCIGACTVDTDVNKLAWGVAAISGNQPSSVTAHGLDQSPPNAAAITELAQLVAFNGTILGGTDIGHATLRIRAEQVPNLAGACVSTFNLKDCSNPESAGQDLRLKAFFYNTPNLHGGASPDDDDFLCFPQLEAELLCGDPQLATLCTDLCQGDAAKCPKCMMIPENTALQPPSGAFIGAVGSPTPIIKLQSQSLGAEDSSIVDSTITLIPVLMVEPFGEVRLAPFWQVMVDALPDACPNFLQLRNASASDSVIEVAAFGTDDVDVHDIDPDRVRGIAPGTGEAVAPISIEFSDIGAPAGSDLECACGSSIPDGKTDMVLRFPAAAWLEAWKGSSQLGNQIDVSFRRLSDNAAAETADCVTLGVCPEADSISPTVALTAPAGTQELPIAVKFTAADADGLDGDVVAERILLDGCPVLDGDLVGDRDGILSAGEATIDTRALCGVARTCHKNNFKRPLLTVEAVDCNGNTGTRTVQLNSKFHVDGNICKEFGNWHDGQGDHY